MKSKILFFLMSVLTVLMLPTISYAQSRTKLVTYIAVADPDAGLNWYRHLKPKAEACGVMKLDVVPVRQGMHENRRSVGQLMMAVHYIGTPTQMNCILEKNKEDQLVFYWKD